MKIVSTDSIIPGGRYHNRRDYMNFPNLGRSDLVYQTNDPLPIPGCSEGSIVRKISERDYLLNARISLFVFD
jgi:polyphosphate kinase